MEITNAEFLEKLLSGDTEGCSRILEDLMESGASVGDIYEGLFARSLYDVGTLWETNRISVAKEHLATAIVERLMAQLAPRIFAEDHLDRSAVVSCSANEIHQVGARMVADTLEMNRWHAHFLGANLPVEDLLTLVEDKKPQVVALSVAIPSNLPKLEEAVGGVRDAHPDLPILLGGQAFRHGGRDLPERFSGVTLLESLPELESFIRNL